MIHEVIVTTKDSKDKINIAPMGIRWLNDNHNSKKIIISPFKPSTTLDNLMITKKAVINFIDDVRVFAGIVTKKKRDWDVNSSNDEYPYLYNTNKQLAQGKLKHGNGLCQKLINTLKNKYDKYFN